MQGPYTALGSRRLVWCQARGPRKGVQHIAKSNRRATKGGSQPDSLRTRASGSIRVGSDHAKCVPGRSPDLTRMPVTGRVIIPRRSQGAGRCGERKEQPVSLTRMCSPSRGDPIPRQRDPGRLREAEPLPRPGRGPIRVGRHRLGHSGSVMQTGFKLRSPARGLRFGARAQALKPVSAPASESVNRVGAIMMHWHSAHPGR
jgi:hypothetical protein